MPELYKGRNQETFRSEGPRIRSNNFIKDGNVFYNKAGAGGVMHNIYGVPRRSGANILCNCVGLAAGAFNETYYQVKKQLGYDIEKKEFFELSCSGYSFVATAKGMSSLKNYVITDLSQKPPEGGIMCWKGSNGVNHAAFVLKVVDKDTVVILQSGYETPGWTERNKNNTGWCVYQKKIYRNTSKPHAYKNCWPFSDKSDDTYDLQCLGYIANPAVVEYYKRIDSGKQIDVEDVTYSEESITPIEVEQTSSSEPTCPGAVNISGIQHSPYIYVDDQKKFVYATPHIYYNDKWTPIQIIPRE